MAALKRKREASEYSEDEDELTFGRQILPVADLPDDFSEEPADGMQYLFTVRRHARQLPHVTRVPNPYEPDISPEAESVEVLQHVALPSQEWRTLFKTRINNFRKNFEQVTAQGPHEQAHGHQSMPDKKERNLWWSFLAGKSESDWNPPKQPRQNTAQRRLSAVVPNTTTVDSFKRRSEEAWQTNSDGEVELLLRIGPSEPLAAAVPLIPDTAELEPAAIASTETELFVFKPREPLLSFLQQIDQRMALHLLMYFTHWISTYLERGDPALRPIEAHARWMFSLLCRVEDQLSDDDMHLLRKLARACIALLEKLVQARTSFPGQESVDVDLGRRGYMSVRSCWIVLSAIATVWAQHDLWIDAENMLKAVESYANI